MYFLIYQNYLDKNNITPTRPLMEVQIPIVNITECKHNYATQKSVIDDRVICAGYQKGGKDSCRVNKYFFLNFSIKF